MVKGGLRHKDLAKRHIGSLSKHDDDNVKKQLVLCAKQQLYTGITLFSTFL